MTERFQSLRPSAEDDAAETRRRALRELPVEGREKAAVAALGDADWRVRQEAVQILRHAAPLESLLEELVHAVAQADNVGRRNAALEVLAALGAPAVARLRRALREDTSGARKFYAEALGAAGDPVAAPDLAALAVDDDTNVAAAALEALVALGGPEAERVLRGRLGRAEPFERVATLDGLVRVRAKLAWEELAPLVDDRVSRRAALPLLGRCGDARALPVLADALADGGRSATLAIGALAELAASIGTSALRELPESVLPALGAALRDGDRAGRRDAASLIFAMRDEARLHEALDAAADDVLTDLGAMALRRWGVEAVESLLRASRHCVGLGRALALGLAAELTGHAAVEPSPTLLTALREAIREGAPALRAAGLRGLASFASLDDLNALVGALADPSSEHAELAASTLRALFAREPAAVEAALREDGLGSPAAIELFAHVKGTRGVDALRRQLSAPRPELRVAATQALGTLADPRSRDDLAFALADEDERVRLAAVDSLSRFPEASVAHVLLEGLDEASVPVRAAMVRALAQLECRDAIEPLRKVLDDAAPVAAAAVDALTRLGSPTLAGDLDRALSHDDPEVAHTAVLATSALTHDDARALRRRALAHEAWHVRRAAARELARDPEAVSIVAAALESESDPMVREALEGVDRISSVASFSDGTSDTPPDTSGGSRGTR
ncbi:MAG: HEAT repeat domain-containing protein [Polyangiales bacterium]|nr:HEAT repeat domain-containing protein [Myxococcales bacterium]MCB9601819.1 HEAT repeat domain-containing protein [Sandaracinus sp.]